MQQSILYKVVVQKYIHYSTPATCFGPLDKSSVTPF